MHANQRRMPCWRDELSADILHWRMINTTPDVRCHAARRYRVRMKERIAALNWDYFETIPEVARREGLQPYLYVSLFDEGRPLPSKKERAVSYHNAMHGRHVTWQSEFSRLHSEYAITDRSGENRQWGILCLAYPQVRDHFR